MQCNFSLLFRFTLGSLIVLTEHEPYGFVNTGSPTFLKFRKEKSISSVGDNPWPLRKHFSLYTALHLNVHKIKVHMRTLSTNETVEL